MKCKIMETTNYFNLLYEMIGVNPQLLTNPRADNLTRLMSFFLCGIKHPAVKEIQSTSPELPWLQLAVKGAIRVALHEVLWRSRAIHQCDPSFK